MRMRAETFWSRGIIELEWSFWVRCKFELEDSRRWHSGKESAYWYRRCKRCSFHPWVGKIPWRGKRQPAPVFLPGKFHGQWSLTGYSSWGCKESDMTEGQSTRVRAHTHTHTHKIHVGHWRTAFSGGKKGAERRERQ